MALEIPDSVRDSMLAQRHINRYDVLLASEPAEFEAYRSLRRYALQVAEQEGMTDAQTDLLEAVGAYIGLQRSGLSGRVQEEMGAFLERLPPETRRLFDVAEGLDVQGLEYLVGTQATYLN